MTIIKPFLPRLLVTNPHSLSGSSILIDSLVEGAKVLMGTLKPLTADISAKTIAKDFIL